jgi:Zn-finger nucleic acid-binding protein
MQCPKCKKSMTEVNCDDVVIDRCISCAGLWFDNGEAETLSSKWIAEFIDVGDTKVGEKMDEIDNISCPRCGELMRRYFDLSNTHLQYEECDKHGKFFDAGEFTLWAESQYL